jgi:hypothetical protein
VPYPDGKPQTRDVNEFHWLLRHGVVASMMTDTDVSMPAKFKPNTETLTAPVLGPLNAAVCVRVGESYVNTCVMVPGTESIVSMVLNDVLDP